MPRVLNLIVKVIGLVVRGVRRLFGGGRRQPGDAGAPSDGVAAEAPGPYAAPTGAGVPAEEREANEGLWPSTFGAPTPGAPTHDARTHDAPGYDAPARDYGMPDYWPPAPGAAPVPDPRELRLRLVPSDVRRDHGVSDEIKQDERTVLAAMVQDAALRDDLLLAFPPGAFSPEARGVRDAIGALHDLGPDEPINVGELAAALTSDHPWLSEKFSDLGTGPAPTGLATSDAVRAIRNDIFDGMASREARSHGLHGEINPDLSPEEQHLAESNQWWSDLTGIDSDLGLPPELAHIQIAYTDNLARQWMSHMASGDTSPEAGRQNAFEELPIWEQIAVHEAWSAKHSAAAGPKAADAVAVATDVLAGPEEGERTAEMGSTVKPAADSSRVVHGPRNAAKPAQHALTP